MTREHGGQKRKIADRISGGEFAGGPAVGVSAELNLEVFPFFVFDRGSVKIREYTFERTLSEEQSGRELQQSWTVRAAGELGLPTAKDQDVYMAVNELLYRYGGIPSDNTLLFTLRELLQVLGWPNSGGRRRRLKESLVRIGSATIDSRGAFYDPGSRARITKTFKLWDVYLFEQEEFGRDPRGPVRQWGYHRLVFGGLFAESWRQSYLSGLDLGFYRQIEGPVARRLYRLVDCHARLSADAVEREPAGGRGGKRPRSWSVPVYELRDLVPLGNYRYASKIKQILYPAAEELVRQGYLKSYTCYREPAASRGEAGRGELLRFEVASGHDRARIVASRVQTDPMSTMALERMTAAAPGLRKERAVKLLEDYGPERCLHYAELLPLQRDVKDPPALLTYAIKTEPDWTPPEPQYPGRTTPQSASRAQDDLLGHRGAELTEKPSSFKEGYEWFFGD